MAAITSHCVLRMVFVDANGRTEEARLVCFTLQGQEYAANIEHVKETMLVRPITRVFLTPPWLSGIINLRGDVVAVIDLAQLLGLPPTAISDESRILIARYDGRSAGLLVDRMADLRMLDLGGLQPPPPNLSPETGALLLGLATTDSGAAIRVLDLPALFGSDRLRAFRRSS